MSIYDDLPPATPPMQRIWRGTISVGATTFNEPVYVRITAFPGIFKWGPCKWMQRYYIEPTDVSDGVDSGGFSTPDHIIPTFMYPLYPKRDDECLVVFDNNRVIWVIAWWPKNMDEFGNR